MSEAGEASGPPWRSVSLRLAFFYGVLVTIIMMVTVSIIYLRTVTVFYCNMERQVERRTYRDDANGGPQDLQHGAAGRDQHGGAQGALRG